MRYLRLSAFSCLLGLVCFACGNSGNGSNSVVSADGCTFRINEDSVSLKWTAFKTTDRIGVGGTFHDIKVESDTIVEHPADLIKGTRFIINTNSVATGDTSRDRKVHSYFFGSLLGGDHISGGFETAEGTKQAGKGVILLKFNDLEQNLNYNYFVEGHLIRINTEMDMNTWNGENAIQTLNDTCKILHTGADGISKLWPDINLEVLVRLDKSCI